ncbi:pyruvate kinase [Cryptosporidium canis]|uniref:Pyruvate kinase n=1 Tax=Cryptosporidium canis TaxID=195482 RepID=A0A9D5DGC1_9CRYT|nr:pyruvate kinase [Cryptosporidium canis]
MISNDNLKRLASTSAVMSCTLGKATCLGMDKICSPLADNDVTQRKTQIICTIGPSCNTVEALVGLIDKGMSVARLNFSHGDHESHFKTLQNIREAAKARPNSTVGIMLDTKGPEIRTGMLEGGKPIELKAGQTLKITTDYSILGNSGCISCSYPLLPKSVQVGSTVLIADGSLSTQVLEIGDDFIICKVLNNVTIGERKNMNLPGCKVHLPIIGDKDKRDIVEFALKHNLDFIALSFVQNGADVQFCRQIISENTQYSNGIPSPIKIISKIENLEGVINFDSICSESDGIMVARGDLGMEIPPEKIFVAQKCMISKCNVAGKPVVTATQMLESMIKSNRPTRAEMTDVANAVLDGSDCVMLSGETANGAFPFDAVNVMSRVCAQAETCIDYPVLYHAIHSSVPKPVAVPEAIACSAVESAHDVNAKLIIAITETGNTARLISKYRPSQTIIACTAKPEVARGLKIARGVKTYVLNSIHHSEAVISNALALAKDENLIDSGDFAVAVHGVKESCPGSCNLMKIVKCP